MSLLVGIVVGLLASLAVIHATRLRNRERVALERRECEQELERAQQEITQLEMVASNAVAPKAVERRPPAPKPEPAATLAVSPKASDEAPRTAAAASEAASDDLRRIEGIGPKIAELLSDAGIRSFSELATADSARLKEILDSAGSRFRLADPESWPQQAALAARGDWEGLASLQGELKGGRKS